MIMEIQRFPIIYEEIKALVVYLLVLFENKTSVTNWNSCRERFAIAFQVSGNKELPLDLTFRQIGTGRFSDTGSAIDAMMMLLGCPLGNLLTYLRS
jgi:hypothetical protein